MDAPRIISEPDFEEAGRKFSAEANVLDGLHGYFVLHRPRLYQSCRWFKLFDTRLGDVLEIGPFYSYTPFVLQPNATSYTVLEGDDPATYALKPLYARRNISLHFVDLFEMFGPTLTANHRFNFPDNSFDTLLCWGTMEHFNFNPVKFVREVHRILKPGGRACIQVPNKASFQNIVSLLTGRFEQGHIDQYYEFENYVSNGKKAFYGFHWREYTRPELIRLFTSAGFQLEACEIIVCFQTNPHLSAARKTMRSAMRLAARLLPRYGTDVCLIAQKPRNQLAN